MNDFFGLDGYPTEKALQKICNWPADDVVGCLAFASSLWSYQEKGAYTMCRPDVSYDDVITIMCFSTDGLSCNEAIITALRKNAGAQKQWLLSKCGGYHEYVFENVNPCV